MNRQVWVDEVDNGWLVQDDQEGLFHEVDTVMEAHKLVLKSGAELAERMQAEGRATVIVTTVTWRTRSQKGRAVVKAVVDRSGRKFIDHARISSETQKAT